MEKDKDDDDSQTSDTNLSLQFTQLNQSETPSPGLCTYKSIALY